MKKALLVVFSMIAVLAMVATGCGKKDELVMATNAAFPPYEFYEGGNIVGIDAELAAKIADELNMKLTIVDTEFGSIVAGVQTGKYDIGMAGMSITEARLKEVNFSKEYATAKQVIIVKDGSKITDCDWLYDHIGEFKVGVQQDTTGHIYCAAPVDEDGFGEENVLAYKTGNDAVQALVANKVDCVIIDNEPAKKYVEANKGLKIL
ncbi:MAG: amino acid ABC transporter substrate-binding protein, partial [Dehalococcoidales bacterium]|nr:amino acid ABC transporter substrate-binding protein [Dehalococcoidales bacterium]